MCCCGVGPLIHDTYWNNVRCGPDSSHGLSDLLIFHITAHQGLSATLQLLQLPLLCSYASYNYSAPRLPAGFKFSKILRAVTNQVK